LPRTIDLPVTTDNPTQPDQFPLAQVTSSVWAAAELVEGYCRRRGVAASAAEYVALAGLTDAIVGLLAELDAFDPAGADGRAHACSTGCDVEVLHDAAGDTDG
jgi:hypothetical protein